MGVDVNCRHPYGWTALHAAAVNQRSHAVKFLLDSGADPNIQDNFSNIYQVNQRQRFEVVLLNILCNAFYTPNYIVLIVKYCVVC